MFNGYGQPMYGQQPYYQPMGQLDQLKAQYQPMEMQQPQAAQNGLIWVQGEAGAKSYLVARGNSVLLMDSEGPTFYIKSVDNAGMPSTRVFAYKEMTTQKQPEQQQVSDYVTRAEFNELVARLEASAPAVQRKKTKEVTADAESAV